MGMANNSLKTNRSLVGKRKYKDAKTLILNESGKTELEFKQLDAGALAKIKNQIRLKAHKKKRENILILTALSLVFAFVILISFS